MSAILVPSNKNVSSTFIIFWGVILSLWIIIGDIILNIISELINALVCIPFTVTGRYICLASIPAAQVRRGKDLFN
jgi:hypothetical protein